MRFYRGTRTQLGPPPAAGVRSMPKCKSDGVAQACIRVPNCLDLKRHCLSSDREGKLQGNPECWRC